MSKQSGHRRPTELPAAPARTSRRRIDDEPEQVEPIREEVKQKRGPRRSNRRISDEAPDTQPEEPLPTPASRKKRKSLSVTFAEEPVILNDATEESSGEAPEMQPPSPKRVAREVEDEPEPEEAVPEGGDGESEVEPELTAEISPKPQERPVRSILRKLLDKSRQEIAAAQESSAADEDAAQNNNNLYGTESENDEEDEQEEGERRLTGRGAMIDFEEAQLLEEEQQQYQQDGLEDDEQEEQPPEEAAYATVPVLKAQVRRPRGRPRKQKIQPPQQGGEDGDEEQDQDQQLAGAHRGKAANKAPLHPETLAWLQGLVDSCIPRVIAGLKTADKEQGTKQAIAISEKLKAALLDVRVKPRATPIAYEEMSTQLQKVKQSIKIESELLHVAETEAANQAAELSADRAELADYRRKSEMSARRRNAIFHRALHPLLQKFDDGDDGGSSNNNHHNRSRNRNFFKLPSELDIPRTDATSLYDEVNYEADLPLALKEDELDHELERLKSRIARKLDKLYESQQAPRFIEISSKISTAKELLIQMVQTIDPVRAQRLALAKPN